MHTPPLYRGDVYHDHPWLVAWCEAAARAWPRWLRCETYGTSRQGRPLVLLTLAAGDSDPTHRSAFWLDGGTHASEWAGIMATIYAVSRWIEALEAGDPELTEFLHHHTLYVAPCLSPDGFQHLMEGGAFVRSTLRPPPDDTPRFGHEPSDLDGDGDILWMRWFHPAGPWVEDEGLPMLPRQRRLDDPPAKAFFLCPEGQLLRWDGVEYKAAPAQHGLDLNRNFPSNWSPFSQFGMDGGAFPTSEPESRAAVEAVAARPNVCAAVTNHTYTGAILVSPYRPDSPLDGADKETLFLLAREATQGTGYRVYKVYPEFIYEEGKTMPGVWADHLVSTVGIPAYTLELWDPYAHAGVEMTDPARAFARPDIDKIRATVAKFVADDPATWRPWTKVPHPQLGEVEVGGFRSTFTFRNPPPALLAAECERAFVVADRVRRALPRPRLRLELEQGAGQLVLSAVVENVGYLSTSATRHAARIGVCREPWLELRLSEGLHLVSGAPDVILPHLPGWGDAPQSFRRHPLHPTLPDVSPRRVVTWTLKGAGTATVSWRHPRTGTVVERIKVG